MSVQTVDYTMKVPKEGKEVVDLLAGVVGKLKAKASIADYQDLLDELMLAIEGIGGVSEEVKSQYRDELAGYLTHRLMGELLPVEEAQSA